jgi:hypothetical protein
MLHARAMCLHKLMSMLKHLLLLPRGRIIFTLAQHFAPRF